MATNSSTNYPISELESIIIKAQKDILNNNIAEDDIIYILDSILILNNTENLIEPIYTNFIFLIESIYNNNNRIINLLINKIKTDIIYYYNFNIENNNKLYSANYLTANELLYFVLDNNGDMILRPDFDHQNKPNIIFSERNELNELVKKHYVIDLKTRKVLSKTETIIGTNIEPDLYLPINLEPENIEEINRQALELKNKLFPKDIIEE